MLVLQKKVKTTDEVEFLIKVLRGTKCFEKKEQQEALMNIRPKVLGESVELEFQPRHKTLFHIDDVGLLFYIVLTGSVHTLIRDSNIKDDSNKDSKQPTKKGFMGKIQKKIQSEVEVDKVYETDEELFKGRFPTLKKVFTFNKGGSFGEIALLDKQRQKRTATMVTASDTFLMTVSKRAFDKIMGDFERKRIMNQIEFLRNFQFFKDVKDGIMMSMLRDIKFENYFSFHSVLYNEGDPISHVYFIKEGEVELQKTMLLEDDEFKTKQHEHNQLDLRGAKRLKAINSKIVSIIRLGENKSVGEREILNEVPRREYRCIITSNNAHIWMLEKEKFLSVMKRINKPLKTIMEPLVESYQLRNQSLEENVMMSTQTKNELKKLSIKLEHERRILEKQDAIDLIAEASEGENEIDSTQARRLQSLSRLEGAANSLEDSKELDEFQKSEDGGQNDKRKGFQKQKHNRHHNMLQDSDKMTMKQNQQAAECYPHYDEFIVGDSNRAAVEAESLGIVKQSTPLARFGRGYEEASHSPSAQNRQSQQQLRQNFERSTAPGGGTFSQELTALGITAGASNQAIRASPGKQQMPLQQQPAPMQQQLQQQQPLQQKETAQAQIAEKLRAAGEHTELPEDGGTHYENLYRSIQVVFWAEGNTAGHECQMAFGVVQDAPNNSAAVRELRVRNNRHVRRTHLDRTLFQLLLQRSQALAEDGIATSASASSPSSGSARHTYALQLETLDQLLSILAARRKLLHTQLHILCEEVQSMLPLIKEFAPVQPHTATTGVSGNGNAYLSTTSSSPPLQAQHRHTEQAARVTKHVIENPTEKLFKREKYKAFASQNYTMQNVLQLKNSKLDKLNAEDVDLNFIDGDLGSQFDRERESFFLRAIRNMSKKTAEFFIHKQRHLDKIMTEGLESPCPRGERAQAVQNQLSTEQSTLGTATTATKLQQNTLLPPKQRHELILERLNRTHKTQLQTDRVQGQQNSNNNSLMVRSLQAQHQKKARSQYENVVASHDAILPLPSTQEENQQQQQQPKAEKTVPSENFEYARLVSMQSEKQFTTYNVDVPFTSSRRDAFTSGPGTHSIAQVRTEQDVASTGAELSKFNQLRQSPQLYHLKKIIDQQETLFTSYSESNLLTKQGAQMRLAPLDVNSVLTPLGSAEQATRQLLALQLPANAGSTQPAVERLRQQQFHNGTNLMNRLFKEIRTSTNKYFQLKKNSNTRRAIFKNQFTHSASSQASILQQQGSTVQTQPQEHKKLFLMRTHGFADASTVGGSNSTEIQAFLRSSNRQANSFKWAVSPVFSNQASLPTLQTTALLK